MNAGDARSEAELARSSGGASDDPPRVPENVIRLARLGGALRAHQVGVTVADEVDGARALVLIDATDHEEVRQALRVALKIPPPAYPTFDRLLEAVFWGEVSRLPPPPARPAPGPVRWDPDARRLISGDDGEGDRPGYSPEVLLRRKPFAELDQRERAAMERMLVRLARRLATHRSRRLVPSAGRGRPDLRASYRRALATGGELLDLARRARAVEQPGLVFLCDTSGSMDTHTGLLLTFVLAVRRAVPRAGLFVFNTELVEVPAGRHLTVGRLAAAVPDWSGGTRIGESLSTFVRTHLPRLVDGRTVVVVVSDGLDRGDPALLASAAQEIQRRARALVWLNPLSGDPRYRPAAAGMQAALPHVDHFAAADSFEALERLLPHLQG
jgi:uncharacterized protein with von Willebrand factor type A (vWA) domain